jgi:mono/diheme cytochrome c family protein
MTEGDRTRSIELYRKHCAECHEADGTGEMSREVMRKIPDFTNSRWHHARQDDRLARSIREGKGMMPAMKQKLEPGDVVLLITLIRDFRGGEQVLPVEPEDRNEPAMPAEAKKPVRPPASEARATQRVSRSTSDPPPPASSETLGTFRQFCVSCHGSDGRGTAARAVFPQIPDFASPLWQQLRGDAELSASILEGKGAAMPAFGGKLPAAQARELVAHLRSFAPPEARSNPRPSSAFYQRYLELREEMNELKREYKAMSRP